MKENSRILVLGGGLVGSSIKRTLDEKYNNIYLISSKKELDLTIQNEVNSLFIDIEPEYVFLTAAKVGGIGANSNYKADFIYENTMIQSNVIHACYKYKIKKLLFMGSSCIYPKNYTLSTLKEEHLMTGPLEETNDAYAIAKINGLKMCQSFNEQCETNFLCVMPSNVYGLGDTYNSINSHVIPSLIMKIHSAKISNAPLIVWGSGKPRREFLYSDDLAKACVMLMENYDYKDIKPFINIGTGLDITIKELVLILCDIIDFHGEIIWDESKPDGVYRKLLNIDKISKLGWESETSLIEGLKRTYADYLRRVN